MAKKVFALVLALLAMALPCACSTQPAAIEDGRSTGTQVEDSAVTVVVTRDFGRQLVLEEETGIEPGTSALKALQAVAAVETKYGGGFVSSIDDNSFDFAGENGEKKDWFFYINGIAGNTGAGDYILRAGDVEHWDFRNWSYQQFVPAIIGDYPQPFRSGYGGTAAPTVVVYEESFAGAAEALVKTLREDGISQVSAVGNDMLSDEVKEQSNLIIVAGPENGLISELNRPHKRLGFYAYLESGEIVGLDAEGNLSEEYGPGSGLIQATQNPWNPRGSGAGENVAWMVTGSDADGVRSAAAALINNGDKLRHTFAAVVSEGNVVRIP